MKILFAETKTKQMKNKGIKIPEFIKIKEEIIKNLKEEDLIKALNIKKTHKNYEYEIAKIKNEVKPEKGMAIYSYNGTSFKNLDINTLDKKSIEYLNNKLIILSGLYGIVRAEDEIEDLRMEISYSNKYYKNILKEYLINEDIVINLASKEYTNLFLQDNFINIHFINKNNKITSMENKKMRGLMLRYLAENKIENIEDIKNFNINNYKYEKDISTKRDIYFKEL